VPNRLDRASLGKAQLTEFRCAGEHMVQLFVAHGEGLRLAWTDEARKWAMAAALISAAISAGGRDRSAGSTLRSSLIWEAARQAGLSARAKVLLYLANRA
jgi:hypothetical protein